MKLDWCKVVVYVVVVVLVVVVGSVFVVDLKEIWFGVEVLYVLFEYKMFDGKLIGFDIDIGNVVCVKLKIKCVWVENDFDGLILVL